MSNFVSRSSWGARHPKATPKLISRPVKGTVIHYEGSKVGTIRHDQCAGMVRTIQNYHMDSNQIAVGGGNDIAYNLLICQHGYIFEGRGINTRSGANGTNDANAYYYAVCFLMGPGDDFNDAMKSAGLDAINICKTSGGAGNDIQPHRHFFNTQCPGDPVVSWINKGLPGSTMPVPVPPASNNWFEEIITMLPTLDFTNPRSLDGSGLIDNVQGLLNGTQYAPAECEIDNEAGTETLNAVKAFQKMKGLRDDGVVGPVTWRALITH